MKIGSTYEPNGGNFVTMKMLPMLLRRSLRLATALAAGLSLTSCATTAVPSSTAAHTSVKLLYSRPHPQFVGQEISVVQVDFPPGANSPSHCHPGIVIGHVVSGRLDFQVSGERLKHLREGAVFYEPKGCVHLVSRNPSAVTPTRVIVFMEHPIGSPLVLPAPTPRP